MALTVDSRFRGPRESGNGGYVAGLFARQIGLTTATVTLRQPPPLNVSMSAVTDGEVTRLVDHGTTVAEAYPGRGDLTAVPALSTSEAQRAEDGYAGLTKHPFPECFVCGPNREPGDGMQLRPGRFAEGQTACVWHVAEDVAGEPEFVWAALDCPGGWTAPIEGRPMVLGRMTASVADTPQAGEDCVVMGRLVSMDGRKTFTATTVYGDDRRELGRAAAIWIAVDG